LRNAVIQAGQQPTRQLGEKVYDQFFQDLNRRGLIGFQFNQTASHRQTRLMSAWR
jgi:hypothetical protein